MFKQYTELTLKAQLRKSLPGKFIDKDIWDVDRLSEIKRRFDH